MNFAYFIGFTVSRLAFSTFFRWRVLHPERVPRHGAVLLACNHASYIDPPLVGAGLRRPIHYLARESLFRNPISAWILHQVNATPVDRDGGSASGLRTVINLLDRGEGVVLFPEGTRTRDGKPQSVRSGIGLIALKTNAPVVPVRVFGTYNAFGRRHRIPRPFPIAVKYGLPMAFEAERAEAKRCGRNRARALYDAVSIQIMEAIQNLTPHREISSFP